MPLVCTILTPSPIPRRSRIPWPRLSLRTFPEHFQPLASLSRETLQPSQQRPPRCPLWRRHGTEPALTHTKLPRRQPAPTPDATGTPWAQPRRLLPTWRLQPSPAVVGVANFNTMVFVCTRECIAQLPPLGAFNFPLGTALHAAVPVQRLHSQPLAHSAKFLLRSFLPMYFKQAFLCRTSHPYTMSGLGLQRYDPKPGTHLTNTAGAPAPLHAPLRPVTSPSLAPASLPLLSTAPSSS